MNVQYKRTYKESYMILEDAYEMYPFEQSMLKENEIPVLLKFYSMNINGKKQLWYDISGKQSLRDYIQQQSMDMERLHRILGMLLFAFEETEKYLIDEKRILPAPEFIYVSRQEPFELFLCYFPKSQENRVELSEMFQLIIDSIDNTQEDWVHTCYRLYEMSMQKDVTLYDLYRFIHQKVETSKEKEAETIRKAEEMLSKTEESAAYDEADLPMEFEEPEDWEEPSDASRWETAYQKVVVFGNKIKELLFREKSDASERFVTEDFVIEPQPEEIEPTELLCREKSECKGILSYQGVHDEEDIAIQTDTLWIGHREGTNSACIRSSAVSRQHAKITRESGVFYIEDLNSTNGTFVNGELLNYKEKRQLHYMDRVQFADEVYLMY